MKQKIKKKLRILTANNNGYLKFKRPVYKPSKESFGIVKLVRDMLIDEIKPCSIYIRGSINTNNFVKGVSDVDFVIVTINKVSKDTKKNVLCSIAKVENKQKYFSRVDMMWLTLKEAESGIYSTLLKLSGVCIYGTDSIPNIKNINLRKGIYLTVKFLRGEIGFLKNNKYRINNYTVKCTCTWIMKRILRSGVEILTTETGQYSRDLYTCYYLFSQKFPTYEKDMYNTLLLALKPTSNVNKIKILVEKLGRLICSQYKLKIKTSSYIPKTARISK